MIPLKKRLPVDKDYERTFVDNVLYPNQGFLTKVKKFTGRLKQLIVRISLEILKCIVTLLLSLRKQTVVFGIARKKFQPNKLASSPD